MNLPGPPTRPGQAPEHGDLFTFRDYMEVVERATPEITYDTARDMLAAVLGSGAFEVVGLMDSMEWLYRFVPPEERMVRIVIFAPGREP